MPPSPLPQKEGGKGPTNVQIVNGFWQFLPVASTTFFDRVYFRNYPRPLFVGNLAPYPVPLPIIKLVVPQNQAFILKHFSFKVYQQSGIGVEDIVEVPASRVASYFGFEVKVGNRGLTDYNTNVSARGQVIDYKPGQAGSLTFPPVPGQGTLFPFSGEMQPMGDNFASYATSGQDIQATVYVLREPEFDARMLSVRFDGYNVNQRVLEDILKRLSA